MRIGVDATCWATRRGYGRFLRALMTATLTIDQRNDYVFFLDDDAMEFPLPQGNLEIVRVGTRVPTAKAASANGRRSVRDSRVLSRAIGSEKLDLFFFPSVYSFVPLMSRAPKIVTIHDVIPELFPEMVFPTLRSKLFWRAKVKLGCAQARLVLTVSDYSRARLARHLKIAPSRLRVVSEASDPVFRRLERPDGTELLARLGISAGTRFVIYVGGFSPHKNLAKLVDAFRGLRAKPEFADVRLLLVGDYERDVFFSCYHLLVERVHEAGLQDQVLFTGYLHDEDLVVLLNLAHALVLPSLCEGFGLPGVEAAACGVPVIATTCSPLVELLGKGAIGVEPNDHEGWQAAIASVLNDAELRDKMRTAGLNAAARLSWNNSARQLLSVFEEVLQSRETAA